MTIWKRKGIFMRISSWRSALLGVLVLGGLGCHAPLVYVPPSGLPTLPDTRLVAQPLATVWATLETQAGPHGFILQRQDPAARLLTFTYTGTPERYVTCGETILAGPPPLQLHSQIHLLVTAESATQTRLMTTVQYTLTLTGLLPRAGGTEATLPAEPITFTSGQTGQGLWATPPLICKPTGVLEQEVFALAL
jgi:hypothetical protein